MNILITGRPGVGKTTLIRRVIQNLKGVSGFFTREIRKERKRMGFAIETVNGRKGILAHVDIESPYTVSRYRVNIADIEEICVPSIDMQSEVIVIDEIGKMELFSEKFKQTVVKALDTGRVIATIMSSPQPFADSIKARDDVTLYIVTEENRDALGKVLTNELKER